MAMDAGRSALFAYRCKAYKSVQDLDLKRLESAVRWRRKKPEDEVHTEKLST